MKYRNLNKIERGDKIMKRSLTLLLTVALLFSGLFVLSSCGEHECVFATEWSQDDTHHWHACTGEECVQISDKTAHTWDNGKVTTKPTQEADGVKTYTCTVCAHTKTEKEAFGGMTKQEWNAVIHPSEFKNFTMDIEMLTLVPTVGVEMKSTMVLKFTKDAVYMSATIAGTTEEEISEEDPAESIADIIELFDYDDFTYDAEAKVYRAKEKISVPWDESEPSDATLRFENGKLVEMKYSYVRTDEDSDIEMTFDNTISFIDYGTTVIPDLQ